MLFCRTKTSNFLVTCYYYGGIVVCAYPILIFVSCVHFRFYFSLPLIFTLLAGRSLLATSISHYLTATLNFHVFFLQSSPLLFSITRSSSFFVIHMSVNIKNSIEKDTTFLCFFFLKSRRTGPCDFFPNKTLSCISVAIPIDWIIFHWYTCGANRLSGSRSVSVWSHDHQIFLDG